MRRDWLTLAFGVVLVWAIVALSLRQTWMRPPADQSKTDATPAATAPAATAAPEPAPTSPAEDPSPAPPAARAKASGTAAPTAVGAAPTATEAGMVVLQVVSDVPGASVFLDREFVGATPLTLRGLVPGPKQLNVTATGHEGYSATIALTEGPNRVSVEFLKVHLNAAVPVTHRHGMGSCSGTLTASPKGLSYDASNKTDAFALAFSDIEEFDVDYLKKNLRIRRRAGKTWNFTHDSADALFTFHRDVSKAREKLGTNR